jgi:protein-S-isoprenylcysteine O-methyltransferase Ste14
METVTNTLDGIQEALVAALIGYGIVLTAGVILGGVLWRNARRKRGTFVLVTAGLFSAFLIPFYTVEILFRFVWNGSAILGDPAIHALALLLGLFFMMLPVIPLRLLLAAEHSALRHEFDNLPEEFTTPMDVHRREYMAKKNRRKF